uniref:Latency associated transcript n=1 Tax=Human herpesvirus 1 TaxID=10298 RepID=Q9YPF8_HHV1|nr:latency associated transcript (LAT) ORF-1 [Human alphaherpesvirus 1]
MEEWRVPGDRGDLWHAGVGRVGGGGDGVPAHLAGAGARAFAHQPHVPRRSLRNTAPPPSYHRACLGVGW